MASHANHPIDCDSQTFASSWEQYDEGARPTSWCVSTVFVGVGNRWDVFCDRPEPPQNLRNVQVATITKTFTLHTKNRVIYSTQRTKVDDLLMFFIEQTIFRVHAVIPVEA